MRGTSSLCPQGIGQGKRFGSRAQDYAIVRDREALLVITLRFHSQHASYSLQMQGAVLICQCGKIDIQRDDRALRRTHRCGDVRSFVADVAGLPGRSVADAMLLPVKSRPRIERVTNYGSRIPLGQLGEQGFLASTRICTLWFSDVAIVDAACIRERESWHKWRNVTNSQGSLFPANIANSGCVSAERSISSGTHADHDAASTKGSDDTHVFVSAILCTKVPIDGPRGE